ncbi:phospholipase B-like 1 isoform X2 [Pseudoliparis swirei]|uniref:phospholipase B-like 1 isoform X2 n=1 Tax=Pseudoliparis swirei TaxID=2059687 RepID=UPI0024BE5BEA|nr:phospholipase B-like 1 isoform X2 [Pseudoliparis swirei]
MEKQSITLRALLSTLTASVQTYRHGGITQEDETTFFLAGYLEGYLTAGQMFNHYSNMYPQLLKDEKVLNPLKRFLREQDQWAREQVKLRRHSDPLWKHLGLILAQLDGLHAPDTTQIYNLSGYGAMWSRYGEDFSYDLCPRAKILRRDQAKVSALKSLKHVMRYNNFRRDPYAKGHPCKTICCRDDLRPRRPRPGGCSDTKVTDFQMAVQLAAEAVNGPTTQGPPRYDDIEKGTLSGGQNVKKRAY